MKFTSILLSLVLAALISCDTNNSIGTSLSGNQSTGDTSSTSNSIPSGSVSCTGTVSDGYKDQVNNSNGLPQTPLLNYEVNLPGTRGWRVGNSLIDNSLNIEEAVQTLSNDGPYYIRFKVRPSVRPDGNDEFCPGRLTNVAWMEHYSKLQFSIYRHSYAVKFDSQMQVEDYYEFTPEQGLFYTTTELVPTNQCSNIIKIPAFSGGIVPQGYTAVTVFEIKSAQSDAQHLYCNKIGNCASPEIYDPSALVRPADCWRIIVQISKNNTEFFKGYSRSDF